MRSFLHVACFILLMSANGAAQEPEKQPAASKQASVRVTEIPVQDGRVDGGQLFKAVADDLHWVAGSVAGFASVFGENAKVAQDVDAVRVAQLVEQFPTAFSYRLDAQGSPESLVIDNDALAELLAEKKGRLRSWLAGVQQVELSQLTQVPSTCGNNTKPPRRIVVAMSGIHGMSESAFTMAEHLHERTNLPMCVFEYPNDAPLSESADRLVVALEKLHRQFPRSKVTLVAHSFGGLVARAALELHDAGTGELRSSIGDRTGVDQLIQVCPPNHGSALSDYAPLLEGVEQIARFANRGQTEQQRHLLRTITDGFNEASKDLDPQSPSLAELNRRPRNPQVRYSILAGKDGPLRGGMTSLMALAWDTIADATEEPAEIDRRIREVIQCAELQKGSGDGVVSLRSAGLEGVSDYEVLDVHHLTWSQLEKPAGKKLVDAIVRRLGISL